jgi:predicted transcriptional regulator
MTSLKNTLYQLITKQGSLSLDEVAEVCKEHGNKLETGERKLRLLYHSGIVPVRDEKHHNIAFRYIPPPKEVKQEKLLEVFGTVR